MIDIITEGRKGEVDARHISVFQGQDAGRVSECLEDILRLRKGLSRLPLEMESYRMNHSGDNDRSLV